MSIQNLVDGPPPAPAVQEAPAPTTNGKKGKRKANGEPKTSSRTSKKANTKQDVNANGEVKPEMNLITAQEAASSGLMLPPPPVPDDSRTFVPAQLTFSFEKAREHLIGVDPRFEDIFVKMKCKPFEHLEQFDPFRCVCVCMLGVEQEVERFLIQYAGKLHSVSNKPKSRVQFPIISPLSLTEDSKYLGKPHGRSNTAS